jgi:hypothetical protein
MEDILSNSKTTAIASSDGILITTIAEINYDKSPFREGGG